MMKKRNSAKIALFMAVFVLIVLLCGSFVLAADDAAKNVPTTGEEKKTVVDSLKGMFTSVTEPSKLVDFGVFFLIFFSMCWLGFSKWFGEGFGKPGSSKGAVIGLSIGLALMFSLGLVMTGKLTIAKMAPIAKNMMFIVFWILLYAILSNDNMIGNNSWVKKIISFALAGLIAYLLLNIATAYVCSLENKESDAACQGGFFTAGHEVVKGIWSGLGGGSGKSAGGNNAGGGASGGGTTITVKKEDKICCESYGIGSMGVKCCEKYGWSTKDSCQTPQVMTGGGKQVVADTFCEGGVVDTSSVCGANTQCQQTGICPGMTCRRAIETIESWSAAGLWEDTKEFCKELIYGPQDEEVFDHEKWKRVLSVCQQTEDTNSTDYLHALGGYHYYLGIHLRDNNDYTGAIKELATASKIKSPYKGEALEALTDLIADHYEEFKAAVEAQKTIAAQLERDGKFLEAAKLRSEIVEATNILLTDESED